MADRPRLLHRSAARGYTDQETQAVRSGRELEPEAIDEATQEQYSNEARRFEVIKAEEVWRKEVRSRHNRLRQVEVAAHKQHVDVHRHVLAIEREIGLMQQLVNPAT